MSVFAGGRVKHMTLAQNEVLGRCFGEVTAAYAVVVGCTGLVLAGFAAAGRLRERVPGGMTRLRPLILAPIVLLAACGPTTGHIPVVSAAPPPVRIEAGNWHSVQRIWRRI